MHEQRPDSRRIERPDASLTMENLVRTRALDAIKSGDIESAQALVEADHGRTLTLGQVFRLYQSELETQAVQLRESQLRTENTLDWFANLFRSLPVAAILVDAQGMVLDANDHALEELGMRRALRSLPVPLRRLMATADGEMRLSAMMARAAAGGTEAMDDAAMRTLDGVARWADLRLTRLPDAGGQPGAGAQAQQPSARFLCVFNDRTARVEAQRAREKALAAEHQRDLALSASQAKTQLLSRVSHELRTPLNAVLGFSQLLLTRPDSMDEASRVQVGHIRRAGEHLLSLVDEVLQINLAESGFLSLALHPVALDAVAQEVLALQQPSAAPLALSLRLDTTGGRYLEGLDPASSYAVLERFSPESIRGYRSEEELRYLVGTGVSAAAIFHLRAELDRNGFDKVKIVASSGFGPAKCRIMAEAKAPIDVVGSGSFLPSNWSETYATADIVEYDGEKRVKIGREFLHRNRPADATRPL